MEWITSLTTLDALRMGLVLLILLVFFVGLILLTNARRDREESTHRETRDAAAQSFQQNLITNTTDSNALLAKAFEKLSDTMERQTGPLTLQAEKLVDIAAGSDTQIAYLAKLSETSGRTALTSEATANRVQTLNEHLTALPNDLSDSLEAYGITMSKLVTRETATITEQLGGLLIVIQDIPDSTASKVTSALLKEIEDTKHVTKRTAADIFGRLDAIKEAYHTDYGEVMARNANLEHDLEDANQEIIELRNQLTLLDTRPMPAIEVHKTTPAPAPEAAQS